MMDGLSTEMLISAQRRVAASQGIPMTVVRKGYGSVGSILLKINTLNGSARILSQVRIDEELVWTPVGPADPMPDRDADAYLAKQGTIDPDLWIVEIEDKQGRHWFPGKIVI